MPAQTITSARRLGWTAATRIAARPKRCIQRSVPATAVFIPLTLLVAWAMLRNIAIDEANPLPVMLGLLLLWGAVLFVRGYSRKPCRSSG